MFIKSITVHAGRTIPNPLESYSNLRPSVSMTAELTEADDPNECIKKLQAQAEGVVEDHARSLVDSIIEADRISRETRELRSLELQISEKQERLEKLRGNIDGRVAAALSGPDEDPCA